MRGGAKDAAVAHCHSFEALADPKGPRDLNGGSWTWGRLETCGRAVGYPGSSRNSSAAPPAYCRRSLLEVQEVHLILTYCAHKDTGTSYI